MEGTVADPATIDACLRSAGFRMGPLELTDLIGQDVNLAVGTSVWNQTGATRATPPRPSSRGSSPQVTSGARPVRASTRMPRTAPPLDVPGRRRRSPSLLASGVVTNPVARTLAMLVNEAVDLVDRGEAGSGDVDLAMTLGTGYPKGPIAWGPGQIGQRNQMAQVTGVWRSGRNRGHRRMDGATSDADPPPIWRAAARHLEGHP
jgi:3-hydroxybutyryl-CoA dehydrogenase